jgi:hydroxymethylpyrimidine kinase/phosphomethylpyrimidine kinase/thiamine-phosphate diphosphorylase
MSEVVWSIAGSDSGGGAGIQADLKAMHSFGVHGCTVITALTAQNSLGVEAINPVSNAVIESQLNALAQDMTAKVIKIGLLANIAQV